jgi:hypothetical protein
LVVMWALVVIWALVMIFSSFLAFRIYIKNRNVWIFIIINSYYLFSHSKWLVFYI